MTRKTSIDVEAAILDRGKVKREGDEVCEIVFLEKGTLIKIGGTITLTASQILLMVDNLLNPYLFEPRFETRARVRKYHREGIAMELFDMFGNKQYPPKRE